VKKMKISATAAVVLGLMTFAGQANAAARPVTRATNGPAIILPSPAATSPQAITVRHSGNWSGYVVRPKSGGAKSFKYISGSYTVPSVNCTVTPSSWAYHWTGLDGWGSGTVEQTGVDSSCNGTTPVYFAWYELYPGPVTEEFAVNPGDAITSSVTSDGSGEYTLALTDQTTGQEFSLNESCGSACKNVSAEVITEDPDASTGGLSDFGVIDYDKVTIEDQAGVTGGLVNSDWSTYKIILIGLTTDEFDAEPGPQKTASGQSSFAITWYRQD
jgi:hypothetical protein